MSEDEREDDDVESGEGSAGEPEELDPEAAGERWRSRRAQPTSKFDELQARMGVPPHQQVNPCLSPCLHRFTRLRPGSACWYVSGSPASEQSLPDERVWRRSSAPPRPRCTAPPAVAPSSGPTSLAGATRRVSAQGAAWPPCPAERQTPSAFTVFSEPTPSRRFALVVPIHCASFAPFIGPLHVRTLTGVLSTGCPPPSV